MPPCRPAAKCWPSIRPRSEADVQLGNFRLKLPLKRLELRQKAVKDVPPPRTNVAGGASPVGASPGLELDLRGERVEAGLERLERYLNDAYMARLPWVRIIHGYGTGAMRSAVRDVLQRPSRWSPRCAPAKAMKAATA